jgi:hypothetical protein
MLWMGIWVHPYTVIRVKVGAKLREMGNWWVMGSPNDVVVSWVSPPAYLSDY